MVPILWEEHLALAKDVLQEELEVLHRSQSSPA